MPEDGGTLVRESRVPSVPPLPSPSRFPVAAPGAREEEEICRNKEAGFTHLRCDPVCVLKVPWAVPRCLWSQTHRSLQEGRFLRIFLLAGTDT